MRAKNYIFTNNNNITITYKKASLDEYSNRDTNLDFIFNYNNL